MLRLEDLATFIEVVDAGSLSAAARRLGLSKSVVSQRLSDLEERLSTRLLHRSTRQLGLTDAGALFYERAARILQEVEEAAELVAERPDDLCGTLRIAAPMSFGLLHAGPAILRFLEAHPRLDLKLDLDDRMIDLVGAGVDMAIRIGRLPDSSLIARRLATSRSVVVCSPAYAARRGLPRTLAELGRHEALSYSNHRSPSDWQFDRNGRIETVRVNGRLQANSGDLLSEAAIAGLGLVSLPTFLVAGAVERRELMVVPLDAEPLGAAVYAVFPHSRYLPRKARALADHLKQAFGDPPYWDRAVFGAGDEGPATAADAEEVGA